MFRNVMATMNSVLFGSPDLGNSDGTTGVKDKAGVGGTLGPPGPLPLPAGVGLCVGPCGGGWPPVGVALEVGVVVAVLVDTGVAVGPPPDPFVGVGVKVGGIWV